MRQRKSYHYGPGGSLDSDEESDPEDSIQAVHPEGEEDGVVISKLTTLSNRERQRRKRRYYY